MEDILGFNRGSDLAGLDYSLDYYNFGDLDRLGLTGTGGDISSPRGPLKTCEACSHLNAESLTGGISYAAHSNRCDLFLGGGLASLKCVFDDDGVKGGAKRDAPVPLGWMKDIAEGPRSHYPFPHVFTRPDDPATRFRIPVVKSISEDLQPDLAAEFIRSCMDKDAKSSPSLLPAQPGQPGQPGQPVQPGRLIDVFPGGVVSHWSKKLPVRLVSSESWLGSGTPDYIALSHCWGGTLTEEFKTISESLQSRLRGIPHDSLTPSFQDAVTITRSLGIRYLWIDALCIIQDSTPDWAVESAKMASIYGDSYLTIAADNSADSFGGILRKRVPEPSNKPSFEEITSVLSTGEQSTILIYRPPLTLEIPGALADSKLSTRGWTFQETILAPRTIHFTATQMVWENRGNFTTEDGLPFIRAFGDFEEHRSIVAGSKSYSRDDLYQIWHMWLVEQNYSHRDFTKCEDRGIAIAGVARRIAEQTGARYLAGLWAHSLATDLGWFRTSEFDPKSRGKAPRQPTWSWISYDFPVAWKPAKPVVPAIRPDKVDDLTRVYRSGICLVEPLILHEDDVELECVGGSDNPFGPISSGKLRITCCKGQCDLVQKPWGPCVVLPSGDDSPLGAETNHGKAIMDHDDSPGPLEYVILGSMQSVVRVGIEVTLLLLKSSPDPNPDPQHPLLYTRVGVAHVQGYQNEIAETWCSQAKEVDIILE
ncbi:HET-domain-containing protein [Apiospora arundinis]